MISTTNGHTQRQWEGKFFRCQMCCWYCRIPLTLAEATKDHLLPVSRGGTDAIANIVPACVDCNRLKSDLTEEEFRAERKRFSALARVGTCVPASNPFPSSGLSQPIEEKELLTALERERKNCDWWRA